MKQSELQNLYDFILTTFWLIVTVKLPGKSNDDSHDNYDIIIIVAIVLVRDSNAKSASERLGFSSSKVTTQSESVTTWTLFRTQVKMTYSWNFPELEGLFLAKDS